MTAFDANAIFLCVRDDFQGSLTNSANLRRSGKPAETMVAP
ncbi:hypothetical protein [Lichenibacterium dinghuense]|nr:hypothetical protein [Lichenibacterium sp. 6Y81]